MKLYVSVDMEGITGLPDYTYVDSNEHNYDRARKIMTDETNYVIEAAFQTGCREILINDSHSKMNNILIDQLHPDAQLITGDVKPFSMMQGLDNTYDGAMFVGYHARAGQFGVMSHAMIHAVRNFYINDHPIGEMGLNAYLAGYYQVPIIFVAGDDQAVREAQELIPNVTTATVKETISRSAVKSLTPKKAGELLTMKVKHAITNRNQVKPLIPPKQPILKIEFNNYGQAEWANLMPGTQILPESTVVSFQAKDILEAYQAMLVMTELAMNTKFS
ncbi:MAG: M55 family metallopeptidase [Bacillota bacterium]|uniref:M55 family metallopeptidase n=1 Tax=Virgibacillus salarius TaxID=447199 RepID=A0A941DUD5_9BACI|nr:MULTISPECIES: M55 family metallopeptidase [Bacillaceae]NAZ08365.1 aminopeptidase [Agaribacter marinus]MBR7795652.1 M55 family metallopeptidase [Virgibacillus salarius]MCC2252537.1 M55 family metallopeptidase [Virgibacillus sp. AGTR]MDY7046562.1 M55 family metallopeptidase [Virgibacillus sp. M23]QRZ18516.1 M55 family metallopeptidase [Virgibacillus sp. AGTR]